MLSALSLPLLRCLYKKLMRSSLSLVLLLRLLGVRSAIASLQSKVPLGNVEKLHSILPLVYSALPRRQLQLGSVKACFDGDSFI